MKYKFIPHTADIQFQAYGNSLEECFENCGYALLHVMCKQKVKHIIKKKMVVKGKDRKSLLYNLLEEILYFFEVGGFLISEIKNLRILGTIAKETKVKDTKRFYNLELTCEIYGDNVRNYNIDLQVKAVTYHDMFIKEETSEKGKRFSAQVVVDV